MPDVITDNDTGAGQAQPQQSGFQLPQGTVSDVGGMPGALGGGGKFFHSLVGTLLTGLAGRVASGIKESIAQDQGTPGLRAMSAGIRAPEIQQEKQMQKQAQVSEQQERQQRMALTHVQYLQAVHALGKADEETQQQAHDVARNYFDALYQKHNAEWLGGTSSDRGDLIADRSKYQAQFPNELVMIAPTGFSTYGKPTYGVVHVKNDPLAETMQFKLGGHDDAGLPPRTVTVTKGTNANDSTTQLVSGLRQGIIGSENSKLAPRDGLPMKQVSVDDLRAGMQSQRIPVPTNLDELWSVANGVQKITELPKKSSWEGNELIIGQDRAQQFIRNFSPSFNPDKMGNIADMRKTLEKAEGEFALENGKNAGQAIESAKTILEQQGGGSPEMVQRAQKVIDRAQPWQKKYEASLVQKDENKDFEHQKTLFDQRMNDGVDQSGRRLTLDEAPMDQPVDEFGNPIANRKIPAYKPGPTAQNTEKTAKTLLGKLDEVEQAINSNPSFIGPLGGSAAEIASKLGLGKKEAQQLFDNILTVQSGFTKMHTSRFSNEILQKAATMINLRMNRDQLLGAIASMKDTAALYEKDDKLMSKAEYLSAQQMIKEKHLQRAQSYLQKAGFNDFGKSKPTDEQKQKAHQLAIADGQDF